MSSASSSSMSSASSSSSANSAGLSSITEAATAGSAASIAVAAATACWEASSSGGSYLLPAEHSQQHLTPDADGNEPGKLFIGGLSQATTEASLRAHFSQFGALDSAVVMMDSVSGRSRGFGFVKFKDPASAVAALQQHQGPDDQQCLDGKTIDVKQSNVRVRGSRAALTRHLKVFVGGVPPEADAQLVRAQFSQYGRVLDVNLMPDPARQRHRGFAFVTFEDERVVQRLVQVHFVELAGRLVEVKAMKPPSAAILQPTQLPQQQLQHQHQQPILVPSLHQQQQQQQSLFLMQQSAPMSCQLHQSQQRQQLALFQHQQLQQQQNYLTTGSGSVASGTGGSGGALPLLANTCSWQPAVAFDPGLAWAAAAAWADPHQQQQQQQQLQQQQQQHYHQHHHLSILEPTAACWLSQPLLAAATAAPWPSATTGILPLPSSFTRQPQVQTQQPQQQQQQQQQQLQTQQQQAQQTQSLSSAIGQDAHGSGTPWHLITVASGGGGVGNEKETIPLPIGSGLSSGQHSQTHSSLLTGLQSAQQQAPSLQHHQLQQQQQQQRQQAMQQQPLMSQPQPQQQQQHQQPDQQLLLQSRAAGDFGGRT